MYEARLYAMSNPQSLVINNAPLPWEPGLYGERSGNVGGYNLNSEGYRGVAYASCEYKGQDMSLSYNPILNNSTANNATSRNATPKNGTSNATSNNSTSTGALGQNYFWVDSYRVEVVEECV